MATLERFQDIDAWQKARELTRLIYKVSKQKSFARDYGLANQIRRASVSVMSNIAEGFDRGGSREFIHFLTIAKGSVSEVESQLYIALDNSYIGQDEFNEIYRISTDVKFLISGFIRYLKKSDYKGTKFKK